MAFILHLDTSGPAGMAMLAANGVPVATRSSSGEREHAGQINALVAEVLGEARISLSDIDAVAVCNGPGSYTGLRIGLAAAKGYCYVLNKPLILHSRLVLMLHEASAILPTAKNKIAIMPARQGEYYAAAAGDAITLAPSHIAAGSLLKLLETCGSSQCIIGRIEDDLLPFSTANRINVVTHSSLNEAVWAAATDGAFRTQSFADIAYATPEYLKAVYISNKRADGAGAGKDGI